MEINLIVAILGVCVSLIGVSFAILALVEYSRLRKLRKELENIKPALFQEMYHIQKASHRVIASYGVADVDRRLDLLKSALDIHPDVFNGWNGLGHAHLEKGEIQPAIHAFQRAIRRHPDDKAGYFDIARAYLDAKEPDLCFRYLTEAIKVDPTSREDLENNPWFQALAGDDRFKRLLWRT